MHFCGEFTLAQTSIGVKDQYADGTHVPGNTDEIFSLNFIWVYGEIGPSQIKTGNGMPTVCMKALPDIFPFNELFPYCNYI